MQLDFLCYLVPVNIKILGEIVTLIKRTKFADFSKARKTAIMEKKRKEG